jgi:uncharacterized membrane protein
MRQPIPAEFPESLFHLVEDDDERILQEEGTLTTSVRGSHVLVTVRLRRWWAFAMAWTPTDAQLRRMAEALRRTSNICDFWLKVAVIAAVIYLAAEIVPAFLPGGAVERIFGGAR